MRMGLIILLAALAVACFIISNVASATALADIAGRPVIALSRDGGAVRVPVQGAGRPALPGEARIMGGQGILLGYRFDFGMPDSRVLTCTIRFRSLSCGDGWLAERAPLP
jgi:hypothetical protein